MDGFQDIQLQCLHPWALSGVWVLWVQQTFFGSFSLAGSACGIWQRRPLLVAARGHLMFAKFNFALSLSLTEPPWSSVTFCSTRPQMTWLFYFLRCREDVLVQRDSVGENGFEWINPGGFPPSESFPPFALHGMDQNNSSLIVPMILLLFAPPLFCQIDFFFCPVSDYFCISDSWMPAASLNNPSNWFISFFSKFFRFLPRAI